MFRTIFRLLAVVFVSGLWLSAQAPDYALKVDVPFVFVDVAVQESDGKIVTDLSKDAFELYENGTRQEIRYFSPIAAPYNILLLFDRSGSTQDKWLLMQRAVAGFIANLRPQDRIAIATFDTDLVTELDWTGDRDKAILAMPQLIRPHNPGATNFYGAVEQTLRRGFAKAIGRRALVVLTDGRDTSTYRHLMMTSRLLQPDEDRRYQDVLKTARKQRIPIYIVAFNTDKNLEPNRTGADEYRNLKLVFPKTSVPERYLAGVRVRMDELTEVSGGRILYPERLEDIVPLYEQISRELGTSFTLGYLASNTDKDGAFRRIEVRTRNATQRVTQSRMGYYAK